MANKKPVRQFKRQYTRAEVLESLAYELKPFIVAAFGVAAVIYFSGANGSTLGKYFSIGLTTAGLAILYRRAKERGVIN